MYDRLPGLVLAYHGCDRAVGEAVISGESELLPSQNTYDWLGHGIYFWEYAPERAKAWGEGGVVGAVIQLGTCLDLTDVNYTALLTAEFETIRHAHDSQGLAFGFTLFINDQHTRLLPERRVRHHDVVAVSGIGPQRVVGRYGRFGLFS